MANPVLSGPLTKDWRNGRDQTFGVSVRGMEGELSPARKGNTVLSRWLLMETLEQRLKYREAVLNTKAGDFKEFIERWKVGRDPSVAVISSSSEFEAAAAAGKVIEVE